MPRLRSRRPLKRWRYVAVYRPELMLCVAHARVAGVRRRWWAVAEPDGALHEGSRGVGWSPAARVYETARWRSTWSSTRPMAWRSCPVTAAPTSGRASRPAWVSGPACRSPAGMGACRRGGLHRRLRRLPRPPYPLALVGRGGPGRDGRARGLEPGGGGARRPPSRASGRCGSTATPVKPSRSPSPPTSRAVGGLRFRAWSERADRTNRLLLRSDYRQPFGAFSGELPGGIRLAEGYGVMEWHDVLW